MAWHLRTGMPLPLLRVMFICKYSKETEIFNLFAEFLQKKETHL